jgi:uncharacterized damage-inducible protein DinB
VTTKTQQQDVLSETLIRHWEETCRKLADLAEELPENECEVTPAKGVRTPGDVIRHVAFWNQFVADTTRGRNADDSSNELPKPEYSTKARTLEALNRTSADAAAALREAKPGLDSKLAEMVVSFIEHTSEHYGQLAVYARLMGVVPPASRT